MKKVIAVFCLAVLGAGVLAGCSTKQDMTPQEKAEFAGKGQMPAAAKEAMQAQMKAYQQSHPNAGIGGAPGTGAPPAAGGNTTH